MVFPSSLSSPPPPPWLFDPGLGPGLVDVSGLPGSLWSVGPGVSHDDLRRSPQPRLDVRPGISSVLIIVSLTVALLHLFPRAVVPGRLLSRPRPLSSRPRHPGDRPVAMSLKHIVLSPTLSPPLLQGGLDAGAAPAAARAAAGVTGRPPPAALDLVHTLTPRAPSLVRTLPPRALALGVGVVAALALVMTPRAPFLVVTLTPRAPCLISTLTLAPSALFSP